MQAIQVLKSNFKDIAAFLPEKAKVCASIPSKGKIEVDYWEVPTPRGIKKAKAGDFISKDSDGNFHVGLIRTDVQTPGGCQKV